MNFHSDTIRITNEDNMQLMARYPDKYFELAIIDPPYGIKMDGGKTYKRPSRPNSYNQKPKHQKKDWDNTPPQQQFFDEIFRLTKNQIIFGANYLTKFLPASMGWVYWGKMEDSSDFSDGELIFTSFGRALKSFYLHQFHQTNGGKNRIHPTQKPVALYKWLLSNYAKAGDKILDTHLGSGSIAIACADLGFDLTACELDSDYFNAATKRLQTHLSQAQLFSPTEVRKLESDNTPELFF